MDEFCNKIFEFYLLTLRESNFMNDYLIIFHNIYIYKVIKLIKLFYFCSIKLIFKIICMYLLNNINNFI